MEPLSKDLGFNITARLDADGLLTLTETVRVESDEQPIVAFGPPEEEVITTTMQLPAQAVRGLLNMLHSPEGRKCIGARQLQQ